MKRATWPRFSITLLLLWFLQQGVEAVETRPTRTHERKHDDRDGSAQRNSFNGREIGVQYEPIVGRVDSSRHQWNTRSGEMKTTAKTHMATHATRTEGRNDWKSSHGRTSGTDVAVDERTEGNQILPGHNGIASREEDHSHTRDNTIGTSHSRTHVSGKELYDRHGHTGDERTNARERPTSKTDSSHHSTAERSGGGQEEPSFETRTEAYPIGLINGLDGKGTMGRSIEVEAREIDETTTIIASALIGFLVLILFFFCIAEIARKQREKKADSTRLLRVFQYLHEFNVDDIDIQLSAAGGFHVGYLNGLAQGINTKKQLDQKTDSSSDEGGNSNGSQNSSGNLSKTV